MGNVPHNRGCGEVVAGALLVVALLVTTMLGVRSSKSK